ncbi:PilJ/NarX-like methyl-accepting chemotaxis transducer [Hasllibacter halocynthiae]|uniref:PilJ/NarX-like methyl-accepting chemotaxis transducer n=1 Tax=Hasllibacter halocynthiae TaxID=595589 RepID=A0A2T0WZ49_9RHOB|nr:type IV pili methyl-accepting chemotaxis transducer N-terminal domain-containing protein [Hasllibacter halocynthiae]PRY91925.1 PilJ/NarX-like methyl-accepting chemotaxis transducer [Hasllibacter halocynthiae]
MRYATTLGTTILALLLAGGAPALAQSGGVVVDENGRDRINYANRLGMLAERIPAAACADGAGIATEQAGPILAIASRDFDRILAALEDGDGAMNIVAPEEDRRILEDIGALRAIWAPLAPSVEAVLAGASRADADRIRAAAPDLLDRSVRLTSRIAGRYADPAQLLQRDALAIEIAGRQRMLLQRMALNACVLALDPGDDAALEALAGDHALFGLSLGALREGMAEAGVVPPPNERIAGDLAVIAEGWEGIAPVIAGLAAGEAIGPDAHDRVFAEMNRLLGLSNTTVFHYALASRLNL